MEREKTIGFRVRTLGNRIKRLADSIECPDFPANGRKRFTGVHGWVTGYLYENRGREVFQRDIERQFSVRRPTMTAILQLMEKNGLITREKCSSDARLKRITLTEYALSLHEKHEKNVEFIESTMRKGITESEMELFFSVVDRITANLENTSLDEKCCPRTEENDD